MRASKRAGRGKQATPPRKTRQRATAAPKTAIVVRPPDPQPWNLTQSEIILVKNTLCKEATDVELEYCLTRARHYRLDPFKQEIWFIPRWDKNADNGHGGLGAKVWVAQVGIYGMAHMAARDHRDYGTLSQPEYGPKISIQVEGHKIEGPEWARVKAFKKGVSEPSIGEAYFAEFCPSKWENTLFWRTMPHRMIAKCAKAQALREAYPDLGGLYIPEECQQIPSGLSPSGRPMEIEQPSEHERRFLEREQEQLKNLTPAQREIVREKTSAASAKPAEQAAPQQPAARAAEKGAQAEKPAPKFPTAKILSYPEKPEGDVVVQASEDVAKLLGVKRRDVLGNWLVKFDALTRFHDCARDRGVKVEEPDAQRPE